MSSPCCPFQPSFYHHPLDSEAQYLNHYLHWLLPFYSCSHDILVTKTASAHSLENTQSAMLARSSRCMVHSYVNQVGWKISCITKALYEQPTKPQQPCHLEISVIRPEILQLQHTGWELKAPKPAQRTLMRKGTQPHCQHSSSQCHGIYSCAFTTLQHISTT